MDALATLVVYARPFTDLSQSTKIHEYIQLLCEEESWKICPNMETNTFTIAQNKNAQNTVVAGTLTETKKMYHGGFFLKLADDDV